MHQTNKQHYTFNSNCNIVTVKVYFSPFLSLNLISNSVACSVSSKFLLKMTFLIKGLSRPGVRLLCHVSQQREAEQKGASPATLALTSERPRSTESNNFTSFRMKSPWIICRHESLPSLAWNGQDKVCLGGCVCMCVCWTLRGWFC